MGDDNVNSNLNVVSYSNKKSIPIPVPKGKPMRTCTHDTWVWAQMDMGKDRVKITMGYPWPSLASSTLYPPTQQYYPKPPATQTTTNTLSPQTPNTTRQYTPWPLRMPTTPTSQWFTQPQNMPSMIQLIPNNEHNSPPKFHLQPEATSQTPTTN